MSFFSKFLPLNSPLRIGYHYARGVIANVMYGNPSKNMVIIGVTGTKGKSTVSNIIAHGLMAAGKKVFLFSTINYCIAGKWYTNDMKMTTPSPFVLQKLLKEARDAGCTHAVIETSSHSLTYHRVYGIDYDIALLTNISQDHLDLHKTMDAYAKTKLRLFANLVRTRRKPDVKKIAIVNVDSAYAWLFLETIADVLYTYGLSNNAQIRANNIVYDRKKTEFSVRFNANIIHIQTHLRGEFNVYNILAALAVLVSQRIPIDTITQAISAIEGIPGRLEDVQNNRNISIFIDYAHTEDSLRSVLETIKIMSGIGRIILVFGATGDRDKTKRPKMGSVADTLADTIILTDDDPYTEDPLAIIRDVSIGIKRKEGDGFWVIPSREDAIRTSLLIAKPNDVVLIAGKGAETVQVRKEGSIPYNDKDVINRILWEMEERNISV